MGQTDESEETTLAGQAFVRLRRDLMANRFKPDERLRFDRMKQIYDIGTAPLREALSRLSSTGLVVQIGQKGFRVASASLDDLYDVVETRRFLEVRTVQEAVSHGSEEWEAALVASFHRFAKVSRHTPATPAERGIWEERHTDFHKALVAGCPSRWLRQLWSVVFDQAERYRRSAIEVGHWSDNEYADHEQLLEAAVARQSERIGQLLHRHIGVSADRLVAQIGPTLMATGGKRAPPASSNVKTRSRMARQAGL